MTAIVAAGLAGTELGRAVAAPQALLRDPGARFVKDHRRTAVAAVAVDGRDVYVKRFKPYAWYRRIEWSLAGGPARRCWWASAALTAAGFAVAPPLAVVEERRRGLPAEQYFVTAAVPGAVPSGRYWRERGAAEAPARRRALLRALARELRRFHDLGFYTSDANADNFLVAAGPDGAPRFHLLDLENVRRLRAVSPRRRRKNLVQLYRPVRGEVALRDRLAFLAAYFSTTLRELRPTLVALAGLDAAKEAEYRGRARRRGERRRDVGAEGPRPGGQSRERS